MKSIAVAALAGGLFLAGAASAGNLVVDGKFDSPAGSPPFQTVSAPNSLGAWTVVSGSVDFINGYWESPPGGGNSVDLDGNSPGSISQTIATVAGQTYDLSFWLSGNPDSGSGVTKTGSVNVIAGPDGTFSFTAPPGQSETNMDYVLKNLTFKATGSTTDLTFAGVNPGAYGAVIGDISVTAAPEPATWGLMLLGIGMAGGVLRYARRARPVVVPV